MNRFRYFVIALVLAAVMIPMPAFADDTQLCHIATWQGLVFMFGVTVAEYVWYYGYGCSTDPVDLPLPGEGG